MPVGAQAAAPHGVPPHLPAAPHPWLCAPADPTGTLIVSMLSKKLQRMAAEAGRQERLHRRAARKRAAAEAAAAEEGLQAPPPEVAAAAAARQEAAAPGAAGVEAEAAVEEPLRFGAALARLLSDPQVLLRRGVRLCLCGGWLGWGREAAAGRGGAPPGLLTTTITTATGGRFLLSHRHLGVRPRHHWMCGWSGGGAVAGRQWCGCVLSLPSILPLTPATPSCCRLPAAFLFLFLAEHGESSCHAA